MFLRVSRIVVLSSIFAMVFSGLASAQVAGAMMGTNTRWNGRNYISGTVFWPSGKPVNVKLTLRLSSLTRSEIIVTTDDSGRFSFSHVPAGTYTIIIDGEKNYQPVAQDVEVQAGSEGEKPYQPVAQDVEVQQAGAAGIPQVYTVQIRLVEKANPPAPKPLVIEANNAAATKRATALYLKAIELAKANDHRGAIEQLKLAVAEHPEFLNAYNEMGVQYQKLNELDKADEALQAALKIKSDAYEPLINRGIVLFRLNRLKDAEPMFREALKAKAESAVGHYYLGRTLNKMERNDEAETEFLSTIKLSPGEFKEAHRLLAVIYLDRKMRPQVVEQLETYLRLVPNASDADELRKVIEQNKLPEQKTPSEF